MNRKIIIVKIALTTLSVLIENDEIIEIRSDSVTEVDLGDIYVGRVKNVLANIDAAFIEIKPGMECYYEINQNKIPLFTTKMSKKPIAPGDEILVQLQKEAVRTKAPLVTCNLNIPGKYAILTVGNNKVGISSKIQSSQRQLFKDLIQPFLTEEYGFIIRTNANDISPAELVAEIEHLILEYQQIIQKAKTRTCFSCIKKAANPFIAHIRDVYKEGLTEIIVEDKNLFEEIRQFLEVNQRKDIDILRLYQDNMLPLYKLYRVEHALESALKERIWTKSGAYLVIQSTEALHVIDVNSGKYSNKKKKEETSLQINIEAAFEAAKQIRLRNLSGIIIIDFINLNETEHINKVLEVLQSQFKKDPVQTSFIDITKLQLVEITRKKVRKSLKEGLDRSNKSYD